MGPPTAGQLRLQVTLSDGQTITLNCAQVDVQFSSGGQMRVADSGAVPLSSGVATAAPVTEPPLPPVYEEAAPPKF